MNGIAAVVLVFAIVAGGLGGFAFIAYRKRLRRAKAVERGLKMVPLLIHLPPPSDDTEVGSRPLKEVIKDKVSQAEVLYSLIAGTAQEGFKSSFYGQRHISFELVACKGMMYFYAAVPVAMTDLISKAIVTAYPGARVEEAEDHNIFNQSGRLSGTIGGELVLKHESAYPVQTYQNMDRDPMEAVMNALASLPDGDGAAIQFMIRPASPRWTNRPLNLIKKKRRITTGGITAQDLAKAVVKSPEQRQQEMHSYNMSRPLTGVEQAAVEAMEEKVKHPGFETLIRVLVSTDSATRSQAVLASITNAFALYEAPGLNGFRFLPAADSQGLVTAFIFRFFPPPLKGMVLNTVELATLMHLPDSQFTPTMNVDRELSKVVDGPPRLPSQGLLFGFNEFRGVKKEIRLSPEDRRRHTYIIGQTGTGKSTMLENLITQDMLAGNGFAFIDPHGDTAEKLLGLVPKERAEDVIYFNPADMDYPLGLNIFEFDTPEQKDFLVQEAIGMLYKLYDPGHTGIIGPRYEHWFRNAALTLMSDPEGSTFIEIPKVFTDTEYLKRKFRYLQDPTVIEFWTKEMAQTSDYHKSEMLGWFVSKFGAFMNNEMMRNILGQTKSSFNLRDIMDNKKILIVNLSKGRIGELNSQLLGMIFIIKFQAAAMGRAAVPEAQRNDFCLYVDEFQNFSTDSFASILSEARKYRLNLIVANQFIGQLSDEIRDAVFGNVGTIVTHRVGPEDAEFMTKQFAPAFEARDLVNIPNYHAVVKLLIGGLPSQPFSMSDLGLVSGANAELGLAVKQLSAAKFGHSRQQVAADILGRMSGKPASQVAENPVQAPAPAPASAPSPTPAAPSPAAAVTTPSPAAEALPTQVAQVPQTATSATPAIQPPALAPVAAPAAPVPAPAPIAPATVTPSASAPAAPAPVASPPPASGSVSIKDIVKTGGLMTAPPAPVQPAPAPSMLAPLAVPTAEPPEQVAEEAQSEIDELLGVDDALHAPQRKTLSQAAPELLKDQPAPEAMPVLPPQALVKPLADQPIKTPASTPAAVPAPVTEAPIKPAPEPIKEPESVQPAQPTPLNRAPEHHERHLEPASDLSKPAVSPQELQEAEALEVPVPVPKPTPAPIAEPPAAPAAPQIKPFDMVTSLTPQGIEDGGQTTTASAPSPAQAPVSVSPPKPPADTMTVPKPAPVLAEALKPAPAPASPVAEPAKAPAPNAVAEALQKEVAAEIGIAVKPAEAPPAVGVVVAPAKPVNPDVPKLEPGEIYVADDGTVYTG